MRGVLLLNDNFVVKEVRRTSNIMKQKEKQYFITVEVDDIIWGAGRTKAASLKDARTWIKENGTPGGKLKTYPTDEKSFSEVCSGVVYDPNGYTIQKNGTLILDSVLEEQEEKAENDRQEAILCSELDMTVQEFESLGLHNKLTAIFLELKKIEKK